MRECWKDWGVGGGERGVGERHQQRIGEDERQRELTSTFIIKTSKRDDIHNSR